MRIKSLAKSSHVTAAVGPAATVLMYVFTTGCGGYADFTLPAPANSSDLQTRAHLELHLNASPVLMRDQMRDVLNPSVVRQGTVYYNFYSEFDGHTWRTALATSPNGSQWEKQGRVLSPDPQTWEGRYIAANGSALADDVGFLYWYQAGEQGAPRIGLARSTDGRNWRKEATPVIASGPRGSWDEYGVADPYVLKIGAEFYAYYLGQDRAHRQQLGLARSPDGVNWSKLRSNPVLTVPWPGSAQPDENGLGEPAVWQWNGWYWMLFTGRGATERRTLIAARSRDGVHWSRQNAVNTAPAAVSRDSVAWDSQVICDPTVLLEAGRIRLWFGGGNVARPDENLNGQIGEGEVQVLAAEVTQ